MPFGNTALWALPFVLQSTPQFNRTNIIKVVNSVETITNQFQYPLDQVLSLFLQVCATSSLVNNIHIITAEEHDWVGQKGQLMAHYQIHNAASHTNPSKVINTI